MQKEELANLLREYSNTDKEEKRVKLKKMITLVCMPLVKKISYGLARRSSDPVEDIMQAGSIGLLKAIDAYKVTSGKDFQIYATCLITGEIRHYIRDKVSMIKAPREIQELSYRINKIANNIIQETGKRPTDEQLADILQMPVEKIEQAVDAERRKSLISLDTPVSFSDDNNEQMLSDKIPDDEYMRSSDFREVKMSVQNALEQINPSYREVIELSFYDDLPVAQIAQRLGISQKQVMSKYKCGMDELRKIFNY